MARVHNSAAVLSCAPRHDFRSARRCRGLVATVGAIALANVSSAHLGGFEIADGYAPWLTRVQEYNAGQFGANSCAPSAVQTPITPNTGLWEALAEGVGGSYVTGHFAYDRTWVNSGGSSGSFNDQALVLTTAASGWSGPALKFKYNLEACDLGGCEPADTDNSVVKVTFWVCWQLAGPEIGGQIPNGYYGDEIEFIDSAGNIGFKVGLTQRATGDTVTYWNGATLFESSLVGANARYDKWEITLDLAADTVTADFTPFSTGVPVTVVNNVPMMSAMADFSAMTFRTSPGVNNAKLMSVDDFEFETDCDDDPCDAELVEVYCVPEFGDPEDPTDLIKKVVATIRVTNNSGIDAEEIRITPLPPGGPVTASPMRIYQNVPGNGGMHTFDVMFENMTDGVEFCFVVTLVDETGNVCCSVVKCFTPDCDCLQIRDANEYIVCSPDGVPGSYLYTFQFDNLRPETIHHIYFTAPTGVTITPDYVALTPPVAPGAVSQQIMVMITGATPGTVLCFDIDIHDEFLNQCCRQRVCIDIPICDDKLPRGACCFEEPGVPAPGCIITTAADCAQTYNGIYQGDNTTCIPYPCRPEPGDTTTHLTAVSRCCWPQDNFTTTTLTICNNSSISRNYMWSLASIVNAMCPVAIPQSFITPDMGNVTLAPGECVDIPIRVFCEGTLQSPNGMSCLQATVTDLTSSVVYTTDGKVTTANNTAGGDLPRWCIRVPDPFDPTIAFPPDVGYVEGSFLVTNNTMEPQILVYSVNGGGTLSINGQPSGIPVQTFVRVDAGQTVPVLFGVTLTEERPVEVFDAILFADLNDDGENDPIISQGFQSASGKPCTGDANGDNVVNFEDLNTILACFGKVGVAGAEGDLNRDGVVDFTDLNLVLSNFGQGCN